MSRAFVREEDFEQPDPLPELPVGADPNYITAEGLDALRRRLEALRAGGGDPRMQRWLEARVAAAIAVDLSRQPRDRVAFGAQVEARDESGAALRYRIVGEDESAPDRGCISWTSPLARALTGARVGEVVNWSRPAGDVAVEVTGISYPEGA